MLICSKAHPTKNQHKKKRLDGCLLTSQIVNHPDQSLCICLEIMGGYWGFKVFPEALQNPIGTFSAHQSNTSSQKSVANTNRP